MKKEILRAETRGVGDVGWLRSRFSFSFARYYDPARMGFGALRVLNDDIIAPANGFGLHPHDNMEIITVVLDGVLAHKDTEGNGGELRAGDVQVMSAGTGIAHSEINPSDEEPLSLFQLWIIPKEEGIAPRYDQKTFSFTDNALVPVASGLGDAGALSIHQDARVMVGTFLPDTNHTMSIGEGRGVFLMVIEGSVVVQGDTLAKRDAVEVQDTATLTFSTLTGARVLAIEVPLS